MMMRSPLGNRDYRRQNRLLPPLLALILILTLGTQLRTPLRALATGMASPFWALGKGVLLGTKNIFPGITSTLNLKKENALLKEELQELHLDAWRNEMIREERDTLLSYLGREETLPPSLLAYVLAAPNRSPYDTLVIDVGSDTNISPGMKVTTDGGFIIGVIRDVLEKTSVVELYSSPGLSHEVLLGESKIPAVAHGVGGGNFRIELPKNTDIVEGGIVAFPGQGESFLAVVERILVDEKTGIMTLILRVPINITELRSVFIDLTPLL